MKITAKDLENKLSGLSPEEMEAEMNIILDDQNKAMMEQMLQMIEADGARMDAEIKRMSKQLSPYDLRKRNWKFLDRVAWITLAPAIILLIAGLYGNSELLLYLGVGVFALAGFIMQFGAWPAFQKYMFGGTQRHG